MWWVELNWLQDAEFLGRIGRNALVAILDLLAPVLAEQNTLLRELSVPEFDLPGGRSLSALTTQPSRNRTARSVWSAWSLLPLSDRPTPYDSASKLDALQTLRVAVHPEIPSQLASNFDYCNPERGRASSLTLSPLLRLGEREFAGNGGTSKLRPLPQDDA